MSVVYEEYDSFSVGTRRFVCVCVCVCVRERERERERERDKLRKGTRDLMFDNIYLILSEHI